MKPPESWPKAFRMLKKKYVLPAIFPRFSLATKSASNAGYAVFARIEAVPKSRKHVERIIRFPYTKAILAGMNRNQATNSGFFLPNLSMIFPQGRAERMVHACM